MTGPLVDSHCHLDILEFDKLHTDLDGVLADAEKNGVVYFLCVNIDLEHHRRVLAIAERFDNVFASVGVHPNVRNGCEPEVYELVELAQHPRVVAIGETGLDYFRSEGDLDWQRERFRRHIRAACRTGKPLIVHSRDAREDTLKILEEEKAARAGGVMHCFAEDYQTACRAMAMNMYISLSGIVTFKSAAVLQDVARRIPLDRLLVETDSPYLAPVPHRGKTNQPAYVKHTLEYIAALRGQPCEQVAGQTTANFFRCFPHAAALAGVG